MDVLQRRLEPTSGSLVEPARHSDLLTENPVYKPFRYPWAYEAWLTQHV